MNEKDRKRPMSPEEKTGLRSMWSRLPSLSRQTSYIAHCLWRRQST